MKLYTEEQIRESLNDNFNFGDRAIDFALSKLTPIELPDYEKVTRFEVIDHTSSKEERILVKYSVMVDVSIQDEGMTMKVFLTDKYQS